jgi:hypothetical protein
MKLFVQTSFRKLTWHTTSRHHSPSGVELAARKLRSLQDICGSWHLFLLERTCIALCLERFYRTWTYTKCFNAGCPDWSMLLMYEVSGEGSVSVLNWFSKVCVFMIIVGTASGCPADQFWYAVAAACSGHATTSLKEGCITDGIA